MKAVARFSLATAGLVSIIRLHAGTISSGLLLAQSLVSSAMTRPGKPHTEEQTEKALQHPATPNSAWSAYTGPAVWQTEMFTLAFVKSSALIRAARNGPRAST